MRVRAPAKRTGSTAIDRAGLANRLRFAHRERYARWWREQSGLSERELREIATGIWADRLNIRASGDSVSEAEAA